MNIPSQPWLRWLVVLVVLTLSAALAYRGARLGTLAVLGVLGAGVALFLLRAPHWGLIALLIAALVVPFEIGTGTQTTLNAAVLSSAALLALWLFDGLVLQRRFVFIRSPVMLPLLGLCLAALLAFLAGQLPWFSFVSPAGLAPQLGGLFIFLLSAGVFFLAAHQLRQLRWLEWLVWLFLALGALYILGRLLPGFGLLSAFLQRGATGSVFWVWLVSLSASMAVFNPGLKLPLRLALGALALAALYIGFFPGRDWASGWLPPVAALSAIFLASRPRLAWPILLLAGFLLLINYESLFARQAFGSQNYSLLTRQEAWAIVLGIVRVNPLLGLGPANYYWYTPLFPIRGYYIVFNSHNQYVDLVAQVGLLGLGFFLWFAWALARLGLRLRDQVPEGFSRAYVYASLGGLAGMLVAGMLGDWLLPFVYNIGLTGFRASVLGWLFLGGLVALAEMLKNGALPASQNLGAG